VLVNITASTTLGLKEYKEVMKTIRQYTAPEATVICGAVFDEGDGRPVARHGGRHRSRRRRDARSGQAEA
jgi:hypothetical protein